MKRNLFFYLCLFFALTQIGCSGISGTGGTVDDTVTSPKQKIFQGKVSQVNAKSSEITLNGVLFKHDKAEISRDSTKTIAVILPGQIISIEATDADNDGVYDASKIEIDEQVVGPISSIDLELSTVEISGQTILITESTNFSDGNSSSLVINNYVAVFGFRGENGVLEATLIELKKGSFSSALDTIKVSGEVTSVDSENGTIVIDGVEVHVDESTIKGLEIGDSLTLNNLEVNADAPNGIVTNTSQPSVVTTPIEYEIDQEIVLEGIPRNITARNIFTLNGYQIIVAMELLEAQNIESVKNKKLIIEGKFIDRKTVLVNKLQLEKTGNFELRGVLTGSTEENTIVVSGQIIKIDRFTFLNFDLEEILSGVEISLSVKVSGVEDSDGFKTASAIILVRETDSGNNPIEGTGDTEDGAASTIRADVE
jgi:ribosomal protein L24